MCTCVQHIKSNGSIYKKGTSTCNKIKSMYDDIYIYLCFQDICHANCTFAYLNKLKFYSKNQYVVTTTEICLLINYQDTWYLEKMWNMDLIQPDNA